MALVKFRGWDASDRALLLGTQYNASCGGGCKGLKLTAFRMPTLKYARDEYYDIEIE